MLEAFAVMSRARPDRRPLDSRAQVTISLVDTHGAVLGIDAPDAPIFGTDVSLRRRAPRPFSLAPTPGGTQRNASADVQHFDVPAVLRLPNGSER